MQTIVDAAELLHPIVGWGKGKKDKSDYDPRDSDRYAGCPNSTFEECAIWYWQQLDLDPESAMEYVQQYWFWGLFWEIIASPFLLITLPFQILSIAIDPEGSLPTMYQSSGTMSFL